MRMLYVGTTNGLNESVWLPLLWLATLTPCSDALWAGSLGLPTDMADMFLKYQLHLVGSREAKTDDLKEVSTASYFDVT